MSNTQDSALRTPNYPREDMLFTWEAGTRRLFPRLRVDGRTGEDVSPDGLRVLSIDQAASVSGRTPDDLADEWWAVYGDVVGAGAVDTTSDAAPAHDTQHSALDPQHSRIPDLWAHVPDRERVKLRILWRGRHPKLTEEQFLIWIEQCKLTNANPWRDELLPVVEHDDDRGQEIVKYIMPISAVRSKAIIGGQRAHESEPEFCGPDGVWRPGPWPEGASPPYAARVMVRRRDTEEPFAGIAYWRMCARYRPGPDGLPILDRFWRDGGAHMLAKCASMDGYRKAYAEILGTIYLPEEMGVDPAARRGGARIYRTPPTRMPRPADAAPHSAPGTHHSPVVTHDAEYQSQIPNRQSEMVVEDDPEESMTTQQFTLKLIELGLGDKTVREGVLAGFRQRLGGLHATDPRKFMRRVLAAVQSNPELYGATAVPVA